MFRHPNQHPHYLPAHPEEAFDEEYSDESPLESERYEKSVVYFDVTGSDVDYSRPHSSVESKDWSGSGFVINTPRGHMIMTNAHVVRSAVNVRIKLPNDSKYYEAKPFIIGNDCDLAVVEVSDPEFQQRTKPLHFGSLANVNDEVLVVGFPIGGEGVHYNQGVISRTSVGPYVHSGISLIHSEVSATINPGNSGGPVLDQDGKVVGVAFQGLTGEDIAPVSYAIPAPVIHHFLKDLDLAKNLQNQYQGFPSLVLKADNLYNEQLRKYHKIPSNINGMLVTDVPSISNAHNLLKAGDVITKLDNYAIDNDGTFMLNPQLRLSFLHIVCMKHIGENLSVEVFRDGKLLNFQVPLKHTALNSYLIPPSLQEEKPEYVISDGFCFTPLTGYYLKELARNREHCDSKITPLATELKKEITDQIIVLSEIFPNHKNPHYKKQTYKSPIVTKINGMEIKNLKDALNACQNNPSPEFFTIELADKTLLVTQRLTPQEQKELLEKNQISKAVAVHFEVPHPKVNPHPMQEKIDKPQIQPEIKASKQHMYTYGPQTPRQPENPPQQQPIPPQAMPPQGYPPHRPNHHGYLPGFGGHEPRPPYPPQAGGHFRKHRKEDLNSGFRGLSSPTEKPAKSEVKSPRQ